MQPRPAAVTNPVDADTITSGREDRPPAEGRPDLGSPGTDRDVRDDLPVDRNDDLPERLGERIENGSSSRGVATGEPDVLPDVETPDETM
ncbi:MAG TPA: hypothetical protein VNL94_00130 [Candidatus Binatia bacterium]|nr:hypothetical protein [Candidatus Binatia bacterium]